MMEANMYVREAKAEQGNTETQQRRILFLMRSWGSS